MARFCRLHGDLDRFPIPHLSHKNYFRSLAQGGPEGEREAGGIAVQFTLMNDAVLVRMQKLYGILDGQHVIGLLSINLVDDSRKRRRFAGASRARHQHNPITQADNLPQFGRQVQRFEVWNFAGDYSHHHGAGAALHEDVDPKPIRTRQAVGHIARTEFLQVVNCILVAAHEIGRYAPSILTRQGTDRTGWDQFSTDFYERRLPW